MALYAIGDLHLANSVDKPMDVFGDNWSNHAEKIAHHWKEHIDSNDIVLIPGDISWAMTLEEAQTDLNWIADLPGTKIMIRGNHDYWWSGIGKIRSMLQDKMYVIQNDSMRIDGFQIAGTRGWVLPTHPNFTDEDEHILKREAHRLKLSLDHAVRNLNTNSERLVCMLHYPPLGPDGNETLFTAILEQYPVELCLYGHLHGSSHRFAFNETHHGIRYQLVSADYLSFNPLRIDPT